MIQINVSAIVSVYNSERFIRGCLEDLVAQTLYRRGELEIVVVNTGSPQNEDPIIREFVKKNRNIKYIKTEQRETVYQAWNRGIKAAEGEYITNANTDDRHRVDALEIMASQLDKSCDIVLVYANSYITGKANDTFNSHRPKLALVYPQYDRNTLLKWCCIGPQPMWRRSLHDELGFFDERYKVAGDYEFWLRISEKYQFKHIDDYLGLFYKANDNLEFQDMDRSHQETFEIQERYNSLGSGSARDYLSSIQEGLKSGDWVKADIISSIGILKFRENASLWMLRALVLRSMGKPSEALDAISRSIRLQETPDALVELAKVHEANGRLDYSGNVRKYIQQRYPHYPISQASFGNEY